MLGQVNESDEAGSGAKKSGTERDVFYFSAHLPQRLKPECSAIALRYG